MQIRISKLDDQGNEQEYVLYTPEEVRAVHAYTTDAFDHLTMLMNHWADRAAKQIIEEHTDKNPRKVGSRAERLVMIRDIPYKSVKERNREAVEETINQTPKGAGR